MILVEIELRWEFWMGKDCSSWLTQIICDLEWYYTIFPAENVSFDGISFCIWSAFDYYFGSIVRYQNVPFYNQVLAAESYGDFEKTLTVGW